MNHPSPANGTRAAVQEPATARGKRTRQALLDAAEIVFGEKGFHSASIAEITQRAGVALGTFYVYFPDKKAAFDELVHELNRRLRTDIRGVIEHLDDRLEMEVEGFWAFFRFVERHPNLYRIIRQAETVDEALHRWHYETLAQSYVRGLKRAQAAGQVDGDLDPETFAYLLMAMAQGLGMRWLLWEGRLPGKATKRTLRRFLESGLAGGRPLTARSGAPNGSRRASAPAAATSSSRSRRGWVAKARAISRRLRWGTVRLAAGHAIIGVSPTRSHSRSARARRPGPAGRYRAGHAARAPGG
jgi:AcrR family transcriptional regulator